MAEGSGVHAADFSNLMLRLAGRHDDAGLITDFNQTTQDNEVARTWAHFLRRAALLLARARPTWTSERILLQAALEQRQDSVIGAAARAWLRDHPIDWTIAHRASPTSVADASFVTIIGTPGPVRGAAWMPPDQIIAWSENEVQLGDPIAGVVSHAWQHDDVVVLARSLSDRWIVSCGYDGVLVIHDRRSRLEQRVSIGDRRPLMDLAPWRDDGLIVADIDGQLYRWRTGQEAAEPLEVVVDPDMLWNHQSYLVIDDDLVWYGADDLIVQSLVSTGSQVRRKGHTDTIHGILELVGHRALSWSEDGTLRIWDLQEPSAVAVLVGHASRVMGAAPLPAGGVISWSADRTVRTWAANGTSEEVLEHVSRPTLARAIGDGVVGILADDGVRLWQVGTDVRFWPLAQPVAIEPLSPGRLAVIAGRDPMIHVVDRSGSELAHVAAHAGPVHGLARSPAGDRLMSWSADHSVRVWRADLCGARGSSWIRLGAVQQALAVDGERLLTGHALGHVVLTNMASREQCWSSAEPELEGLTVAGAVVASWSRRRVCVRNLEDGSIVTTRDVEPCGPTVTGKNMLALTRSRLADVPDAVVWRMDTGALVSALSAPGARWSGASWLPGGDVMLWSDAGELFRWSDAGAPLVHVPIGRNTAIRVIAVGATRVAIVTNEGPLLVASVMLAEQPMVFAQEIEDAMELTDGRMACWTASGDINISSVNCDRVEHVARGRGHRLAWARRTPRGMVAIDDDGVARYVSCSTTVSVYDVPVRANCAMVSADESMIAISRHDGVDVLRVPSLDTITCWIADGPVELHGVTRDHDFIISLPDGSVDVIEIGFSDHG